MEDQGAIRIHFGQSNSFDSQQIRIEIVTKLQDTVRQTLTQFTVS